MNAESTVFRSSRPAVVVAPGGEGVRLAAWVLALPMRLAGTVMGRRLVAAAALAMVLVATVGFLYDSADPPRAAGRFEPAAGVASEGGAPGSARRTAAAAPAREQRGAGPGGVAAAWFAASQRLAADKVRALQQRRLGPAEVQVLVVAEAAGASMPSEYVTVRKGAAGWEVR
jgi:hypothetical protein